MFHPEIPYAEALRRGSIQEQILALLDRAPNPDWALAEKLITERLPALARA